MVHDSIEVTVDNVIYPVTYYYALGSLHIYPLSKKREDYLNYPILKIKTELLKQLNKSC